MKKGIILFLLIFTVAVTWNTPSSAVIKDSSPTEDSEELMVRDILMLFLGEAIEQAVNDYYAKYLTESPVVYPYQIDLVHMERVNGFRGFHFLFTLELTPVVGPHISVGKDRLTFEISPVIPGLIKLNKFEHLETHELPPHWQDIIKQNHTNSGLRDTRSLSPYFSKHPILQNP